MTHELDLVLTAMEFIDTVRTQTPHQHVKDDLTDAYKLLENAADNIDCDTVWGDCEADIKYQDGRDGNL